MKPYTLVLSFSLALSLMSFGTAQATAYKWVDEKGEIHYSQTPPNGSQAELIKTPKAAPTVVPEKPTTASDSKPADAGATSEEPPVDAKAKAEDEEIRAENCTQARKNLETYQNAPRIDIKDANGLYHRLSDEERKVRLEETQKKIEEFCD